MMKTPITKPKRLYNWKKLGANWSIAKLTAMQIAAMRKHELEYEFLCQTCCEYLVDEAVVRMGITFCPACD